MNFVFFFSTKSDGLLDSKRLLPLDDLIAQHPELGDRLDEAWEAQSFKEIRCLKILLPTAQPADPPDPEAILDSQSSEDGGQSIACLCHSFPTSFQQQSSRGLLNSEETLPTFYMMRQDIADTYARLFRMVDEFSKKSPSISVRELKDSGS
ncbi:uncharacterized protein EI90DRAFT_2694582 [Cantharellus anzutake]|uniref:uncharacterized protein n=1 Tax=Cantharellus anzutake TaxID=1750568 RepID=UPI001908D5F3|nr:uncharacterized protein EI90DRAFT_2694582 [Cantharellus anzutake]KAF8318874.1 hypothetical protein EI90DRAFT_2694582 [Cantharellus anzutake]